MEYSSGRPTTAFSVHGTTVIHQGLLVNDIGDDKVLILNTDGSLVREITADGDSFNLLYNERNDQLFLRQ
jgi:hypothetical protein